MLNFIKKFLVTAVFFSLVSVPCFCFAQNDAGTAQGAQTVVKLENPLATDTTDAPTVIGLIIKGALGLIGAVALAMFFWGGLTWFTSGGNPEKVKSGTATMLWAGLGLILTFGSYVILNAVLKIYLAGG